MIFLAILPKDGPDGLATGQIILPYILAAPICFVLVIELSIVRKARSQK
jgi:hypothetical protein